MSTLLHSVSHIIKNNTVTTAGICMAIFQRRLQSTWGAQNATDWNKAVKDAEKIVGYPTSFMSLRCLLSDELSHVALQMRKLVGTRHPLLKTARGLVYDKKNGLQTRGLVILLMAKAAGLSSRLFKNTGDSHPSQEGTSGILTSQRNLAEITEMIYTANLIHKGVVNINEIVPADGLLQDMEFGNNMAILSGDFLLASSSVALAELKNTHVVETISSAICDLMEAEFIFMKDASGHAVLQKGVGLQDWLLQTYLAGGSLLGKSCAAALELSNHSAEMQKAALTFGTNMVYSHQMFEDIQPFLNPDEFLHKYSITSAPIIKLVELCPDLLEDCDLGTNAQKTIDLVKRSTVLSECQALCRKYRQCAIDALSSFPKSEAKTALINMVEAVIHA